MARRAPSHLRPAARALYLNVDREYALDGHHRTLLLLACEALDRCVAAREALDEHGTTFIDRYDQPRARPEIAIERDSRLAFARLLRELDLDADAEASPAAFPVAPPRARARRAG